MQSCCNRIDATKEDGSFARLFNDSHREANMSVKIVTVNGEKYPAFFTRRDVQAGEELTYSYGGNNNNYPWRQVVSDSVLII